jgi:RND family efflux transporter MFP subunit
MRERTSILLPFALLVLGLAACRDRQNAGSTDELPVAEVRVLKVERKSLPVTEDVVGTVRSRLRASVEAKVSARIEKVLVSPGELVTAGQALAQLDAREIQARLDQARAGFEQAEREAKRFTQLIEENAVARSEYDAVQARFRIASASVVEAETMLGYTKISAPFAGVVSRKLADVGDLAAPGKALLELEDPRSLRFEADLPESLISKISVGMKLRLRVSTVTNELDAVVAEIAPTADSASRTFLVKMDLPAGVALPAGQFGRVTVPLAEGGGLRVPGAAVVVRGQMEIVFVVQDNRAQLRLVKSGKHLNDEIEILSGLEPGEVVVTSGASKLRDGQRVQVRP